MIPGMKRILEQQYEQNKAMGINVSTMEQEEDQSEILKIIFQYMKEKNKEIMIKFEELKKEQENILLEIKEIKDKIQ